MGRSLATEGLIGLVLMLPSLALAPLAIAVARRVFPGRNVFFARWGFSHVALAALVWVALSLGIAAVRALAGAGDPDALETILLAILLDLAVAAVVVLAANRLDPVGWRCLGLARGGHGRAALVGLGAYVVAVPGLVGVLIAWPALLESLGLEPEPQAILIDALGLEGLRALAFAVLAVAVVPFLEELVFRAFLQPLLVQNLGDRGGVAASSAAFALLHGTSAFLPIFALSLVLGSVMLRTQRLTASWLVHALHNGVMLGALFLVPGARDLVGESLIPFAGQ